MALKKYLLVFAIILSILSVFSTAHAFGIGISPGIVNVENALVGTELNIRISVSNPNDYDISVNYQKSGEIADWIKTGEPIVVAPKSNRVVTVTISIPADAQNRMYSGSIIVAASPVETVDGTGSAVVAAAGATINVMVTSERLAIINVINQELYNIIQGYPLETVIHLENKGNAEAQISYGFEVWDSAKKEKFYETSMDGPLLMPNEKISDLVTLNLPPLYPGEYLLITRVYSDGILIQTIERGFTIYAPGEVLLQGKLIKLIHHTEVETGELTSIQGLLQNVGDITIFAKLKVQIFNINGVLLDVVESNIIKIEPGENKLLETYHRFDSSGKHHLKAVAVYSGTTSNEVESFIDVSPKQFEFDTTTVAIIALIAVMIVLAIFIAFMFSNKKNKKTEMSIRRKR